MKWEAHLGLLVSAALGLFVVLNILSEAAWHPETAKAILQAGGTANVLVGVSLTMPITMAPFIFLAMLTYTTVRDKKFPPASLLITTGLAFFAGLMLLPLYKILIGVPFVVILSSMAAYRNRAVRLASPNDAIAWAFVVAWIWAFATSDGWLPVEVVQHADGNDITGYVLNDATDRWAVLALRPREVVYIPSRSIEGRHICVNEWYDKPLLARRDVPDYPECPQ